MTEPNYLAFTKFSIFTIFAIFTIITIFIAIRRVPLSQVRWCARRSSMIILTQSRSERPLRASGHHYRKLAKILPLQYVYAI